jgi:hypothetical protein
MIVATCARISFKVFWCKMRNYSKLEKKENSLKVAKARRLKGISKGKNEMKRMNNNQR